MTAGPCLKWVGGKGGALERLRPLLPKATRGYRQPFFGGGTPFWQVYAGVRPAILTDTNERLIDFYVAVRDHLFDLTVELHRHEPSYGRDHYYATRDKLNQGLGSLVERAGYFAVVNKWGFNGLWRVNSQGHCNVAFGRTSTGAPPKLCDPQALLACSRALQGVTLRTEDFAATLGAAGVGDAVYLDPPFHPVSETADFTSYTSNGFSYADNSFSDHSRLLAALRKMDSRGVRWVLSNADVPATREAYEGWTIVDAKRSGGINSDTSKRGSVGEIVVIGKAKP